jgi:hypothetical protein
MSRTRAIAFTPTVQKNRPDARPQFVREMSPERREYRSILRPDPAGSARSSGGAVRSAGVRIRRKAKSLGARKGKDASPTAALSARATIEQGDDRQDVQTAPPVWIDPRALWGGAPDLSFIFFTCPGLPRDLWHRHTVCGAGGGLTARRLSPPAVRSRRAPCPLPRRSRPAWSVCGAAAGC